MSERLPVRIDPLVLVEKRRELEGRLPVAGFERLAPLLAQRSGDVAVRLSFGRDERGIALIRGHIKGELMLACQRCLGGFGFPIDIEVGLGLLDDIGAEEKLIEPYDPLVIGGEPLVLAELVEDELILAVPDIPMHADDRDCHGVTYDEAPAEPADEQRSNPFSVLEQLKQK